MTVLASGLRYPEGPAFDHLGRLFVVELGGRRVSTVDDDGTVAVFAEIDGSPNGAAFAPSGDLFICNNGGRHPPAPSTDGIAGEGGATPAIQRVSPDGRVSTAVDVIDGVPLNAPNDICFDPSGGYYFSDPSWEFLDDGMAGPGSVCYVDAAGVARRVHTGLRFPNGVAMDVADRGLFVTESSTGDLWRFPIESPGALGTPERFGSCGADGLPDGMALDRDGNVLVASHGTDRLMVFGADGTRREPLDLGEGLGLSNVCFGGPDRRTLYITAAATGTVLTVEWHTPGLPLHDHSS